jgi:hypothetical protein
MKPDFAIAKPMTIGDFEPVAAEAVDEVDAAACDVVADADDVELDDEPHPAAPMAIKTTVASAAVGLHLVILTVHTSAPLSRARQPLRATMQFKRRARPGYASPYRYDDQGF